MADPGDLRARILEISERLLETEGLAALSMREVARRAGVTHQAPYHHFGDREGILASLIEQGFEELAARLQSANRAAQAVLDSGGMLNQASRFELALASGEAYIGYAVNHPGLFRIMFRPEQCDLSRFERSVAAGEKAYAQLMDMVRLLHGQEANDVQCRVYWAQVHGLACLLLDGPAAGEVSETSPHYAATRASLALFARTMVAGTPAPGA